MTNADMEFVKTAREMFMVGSAAFLIAMSVYLLYFGAERLSEVHRSFVQKRQERATREAARLIRLQREAEEAIKWAEDREQAAREYDERDAFVLLCARAPRRQIGLFASAEAATAWAKAQGLVGKVALSREKQADAASGVLTLH